MSLLPIEQEQGSNTYTLPYRQLSYEIGGSYERFYN